MRIVVIGAGAMGTIYAGRLSLGNEVYVIDKNQQIVDKINEEGVQIEEDGSVNIYYPKARTSSEGLEKAELVILFVKAMYSKAALEENKAVIGENTRILTLQNGAGHEQLLMQYVPKQHVIIGTTEDNGAVLKPGYVKRGGTGITNVGMIGADREQFLPALKQCFDRCGFKTNIHESIQQLIWEKLFTNVSLSAITGILQVKMGYIAENAYAWKLTESLVYEAVEVAKEVGVVCDVDEILEKIRQTSKKNPQGFTSIAADLRDGRRTEVDTISGSVVRIAQQYNISTPLHEFVVTMVHAMEDRTK